MGIIPEANQNEEIYKLDVEKSAYSINTVSSPPLNLRGKLPKLLKGEVGVF